MAKDDLRPKGTVQVKCSTPGCEWEFWVDCLDKRLPDGPFYCPMGCNKEHNTDIPMPKAEA